MRTLLTGGAGQLGWELRRALSIFGEVVAPARDVLDLSSADSITAAVRGIRPDLVVNAGAYTEVDKAESESDLAMKVNGVAPRVIAEEARRSGAMVVHFSTDYVFDGNKDGAYREEDAAAPLNAYGRTKLAGERTLQDSGCPHLIFRTSWVYGTRGRNFFLTVMKLARERRELKLVNDQFGAPTPARLIAEATASAIGRSFQHGRLDADRFGAVGGLYHMTAAGRTTWHEFALAILRGMDGVAVVQPIAAAAYPSAALRPRNSVLDNARLEKTFGLRLPDWEVGLQLCLEEYGAGPGQGAES